MTTRIACAGNCSASCAAKCAWATTRREPYTDRGIRRVACLRCGAPARFQWQICADGNRHRPICAECDIALNALVLKWMHHPAAGALVAAYADRLKESN